MCAVQHPRPGSIVGSYGGLFENLRMRIKINLHFWRETHTCKKVPAGSGQTDKMIASARPRPKGVEHALKGKGKRSTKPSKIDGGKNKSTKKVAGQSQASTGGVRGQSQSCHQCRQSIHSSKGVSEVKSGRERLKCSQCTRYW